MTIPSRSLFRSFTVCGALLILCPTTALAQTPEEKTAARAAAEAGRKAFDAEQYEEALRLLMRAEKAYHAPTHLLLAARTHEKMGRLVEARELLLKVKHESLSSDAPRAFHKAQEQALAELKLLEGRIPKITVHVNSTNTEGVEVVIDGKVLPPTAMGIPYPVNPGTHKISAKAGDLLSSPVEVQVSEGQEESITLKLELVREEKAAAPSAEPSPQDDAQQLDEPRQAESRGQSWMFYTGLGVGIGGLAVGTTTGLLSLSKNKKLNDVCVDGNCPAGTESSISQAKTMGTISTIGFAVGGAGLALGIYALLKGGSTEEKPMSAGLSPRFSGSVGPGISYVQSTWRFQ